MRDECIRDMYPELTPAQRAVYARLSDQFEEVKGCLWAICWQVNPTLNDDVVDDSLCGPTIHLLRCLCGDIDWYVSEYLEADDDGVFGHQGDARDEVVEEGDDDRGLEDSGDVEDEVLEEVDPAGAGASSVTGQGPGTIEAGTTDAPSPAPAPWREKLRQLRVDQLARAAREKSGPPVTP